MPNDILLDDSFNIIIKNGDFAIGESTYQHQKILLLADKGQFKSAPTVGVGSRRYLESPNVDDLAREIRQQFVRDGMTIRALRVAEDLEINIDAIYQE
ncbi:hypothetical protein OK18_19065 [Chryseobacterium gallinarum]|uniref:Oxidase n=1 Tax=Chryseobacterium gallinarum TaxID=1324352 RepID=A0A0G3M8X3_CHRGL|nr:hypothetical protein [Chryseobacterium gallinarum]AKK74433.1 hypothetical protein OK18_19065 [Chryseobacterium gallinarum]